MILNVQDLTKTFTIHALGRSVAAFRAVSFSVDAGQLVLLRGPNGAGKSTLLRCLYRTYLPSGGSARYESERGPVDLASAADPDIVLLRRTELGFVTQFLRPRPRVSALDLAAEPLLEAGVDPGEARARANDLLAALGLKADIRHAYPGTFSGGEQQKVNVARAVIAPRRLLLLDEPTASLDATARLALVARLRELKALGVAMVGIFHHPEDVRDLVDAELELAPAA